MLGNNPPILVTKRPLLDEYSAPAVEFTVKTDRSEPVRFRLVEELPEPVSEVDVGFHREHGCDRWSVRDERTIVYSDVVRSGKSVRTLYCAAVSEQDFFRRFMAEPTVEVATVDWVDEPGPDDWVRDDDEVQFRVVDRAVTDGGSSSEHGCERERPFGPDDDPIDDITKALDEATARGQLWGAESRGGGSAGSTERRDESPPSDSSDGTDDAGARGRSADGETRNRGDGGGGGTDERRLIDRLAAEVERADDGDESVRTLRETVAGRDRKTAAKVDHCLVKLGEFEAYVDALEQFLDEEGGAQEVLEAFRSDLAALDDRVGGVESDVENLEESQERIRDRVADAESAVEALDRAHDRTEAEMQEQLSTVESDVENLESDVESVVRWRDALTEALSEQADGTVGD